MRRVSHAGMLSVLMRLGFNSAVSRPRFRCVGMGVGRDSWRREGNNAPSTVCLGHKLGQFLNRRHAFVDLHVRHLLLRIDQALGGAMETIDPVRPEPPASAERLFAGPTTQYEAIAITVRELVSELVLLLDGGDTLHGSYTALQTQGADMVRVVEALGVDATTAHWEFTLGHERMSALFGSKDKSGSAKVDFLAGNIVDNEFEEPVFKSWRIYE